jgi:RimJ/RimL family protein N-acetyltransferase
MNLRPIRPGEFEIVAGWLQDERNHRWLDFGGGRRTVDAVGLKVMCQRDLHWLRVFAPEDQDRPAGLVGLSNVDSEFRTAEAWCVLGEKRYGPRDLTIQAVARMLEHGFTDMALRSIFAWTVEINRGGRRLLERLHFTYIGRRRRCHMIKGKLYDRLLFDLVPEEFRGYEEVRTRRETRAAAAAAGAATGRDTR